MTNHLVIADTMSGLGLRISSVQYIVLYEDALGLILMVIMQSRVVFAELESGILGCFVMLNRISELMIVVYQRDLIRSS
jgi:hypothetical protein